MFQNTSAKSGQGVDELFDKLSKKLVNPDGVNFDELSPEEFEERYHNINAILNGEEVKKKKKSGCC